MATYDRQNRVGYDGGSGDTTQGQALSGIQNGTTQGAGQQQKSSYDPAQAVRDAQKTASNPGYAETVVRGWRDANTEYGKGNYMEGAYKALGASVVPLAIFLGNAVTETGDRITALRTWLQKSSNNPTQRVLDAQNFSQKPELYGGFRSEMSQAGNYLNRGELGKAIGAAAGGLVSVPVTAVGNLLGAGADIAKAGGRFVGNVAEGARIISPRGPSTTSAVTQVAEQPEVPTTTDPVPTPLQPTAPKDNQHTVSLETPAGNSVPGAPGVFRNGNTYTYTPRTDGRHQPQSADDFRQLANRVMNPANVDVDIAKTRGFQEFIRKQGLADAQDWQQQNSRHLGGMLDSARFSQGGTVNAGQEKMDRILSEMKKTLSINPGRKEKIAYFNALANVGKAQSEQNSAAISGNAGLSGAAMQEDGNMRRQAMQQATTNTAVALNADQINDRQKIMADMLANQGSAQKVLAGWDALSRPKDSRAQSLFSLLASGQLPQQYESMMLDAGTNKDGSQRQVPASYNRGTGEYTLLPADALKEE